MNPLTVINIVGTSLNDHNTGELTLKWRAKKQKRAHTRQLIAENRCCIRHVITLLQIIHNSFDSRWSAIEEARAFAYKCVISMFSCHSLCFHNFSNIYCIMLEHITYWACIFLCLTDFLIDNSSHRQVDCRIIGSHISDTQPSLP